MTTPETPASVDGGPELLPCPLDGCHAYMVFEKLGNPGGLAYEAAHVQTDCGVSGPDGRTTVDAARRWNTRRPTRDAALVQELRQDLNDARDQLERQAADNWELRAKLDPAALREEGRVQERARIDAVLEPTPENVDLIAAIIGGIKSTSRRDARAILAALRAILATPSPDAPKGNAPPAVCATCGKPDPGDTFCSSSWHFETYTSPAPIAAVTQGSAPVAATAKERP